MPAPILESVAQRLYDGIEPLAYDDANQGFALALYLAALGTMLQIVDDYSRDQVVNGEIAPGWSQLLDVERAPAEVLPWLAQFVGTSTQDGLGDAAQRARIQSVGGWNRGTVAALMAAAQQYLTGTKTVIFRERDPAASASDPAYGLTVITYRSETPVEDWDSTNLITNGGFETNTTGWAGFSGATIVRVTTDQLFGLASGLITAPAVGSGVVSNQPPAANGQAWAGSVYVKGPVGTSVGLYLQMLNGGVAVGSPIGFTNTPLTGGWQRITAVGTLNDPTTTTVRLVIDGRVGGGQTFNVDGAQLEQSSAVTPYIETNGAPASRPTGQGKVGAALRSQKPAGIVLVYKVLTGEDYQSLLTNHPLYSNVFADFATYQGVATATPGT